MTYQNQLVLNEIISEKQSEIEKLKEQNRLLIKRICQFCKCCDDELAEENKHFIFL